MTVAERAQSFDALFDRNHVEVIRRPRVHVAVLVGAEDDVGIAADLTVAQRSDLTPLHHIAGGVFERAHSDRAVSIRRYLALR